MSARIKAVIQTHVLDYHVLYIDIHVRLAIIIYKCVCITVLLCCMYVHMIGCDFSFFFMTY